MGLKALVTCYLTMPFFECLDIYYYPFYPMMQATNACPSLVVGDGSILSSNDTYTQMHIVYQVSITIYVISCVLVIMIVDKSV